MKPEYRQIEFDKKKKELALFATRIKDNLDEFKRPLIIEFTGTPKAGKTTCVEAISKFFRRNNIPTHVITERASICPLRDKHHLFFNVWTGCTSLTQMLEALENRVSVIILDRGIFDTLVWMDHHFNQQAISPKELTTIRNFFLLDRWLSRIDIVVSLSVEPEVALQREFKDQITDFSGSIMNKQALNDYNASLHHCIEEYKDSFRILPIDTTNKIPVEGVADIAFTVLSVADDLVDEEVGVVKREFVRASVSSLGAITEPDKVDRFMQAVINEVSWVRRTKAESDPSLIQLVPVVSIVRNSEILLVSIRGEKQGRLTNRYSIWVGGHMRKSDLPARAHKKTVFRRCLIRELDEELRVRRDLDDIPTLPQAIIWDDTKPKTIQHLGLFYEYKLSSNVSREILHLREIWESPAKSLFTRFVSLDDKLAELSELESWSAIYLHQVHNISFPPEDRQAIMF